MPFGLYPLGFHAPTALIAGLWGDLGRSGLATAALVHAFFPVAVYLCLRRGPGLDAPALAAAVAVVWLARSPQNYVGWGGNPSVLGTAFALVALRRLADALDSGERRAWLEAALLAVATALTHPTAAAVACYAGLALLLWRLIVRRDLGRERLGAALPALLVGLVLLAPLVSVLRDLELSGSERAWIQANLKSPPPAPAPGFAGAFRHLSGQCGDTLLMVVLVVGLLRVPRDRGRGLLAAAAALVAVEVLAVLAVGSWLPLTTTVVPDRVIPFALPVVALPLRGGFDDLGRAGARWRRGGRARLGAAVQLAVAVVLVVLVVAKHLHYHHRGLREGQIVTRADREALDWIAEHAPPEGLIVTEYFDAGQFVPALAGRPHSQPQLNPIWADEGKGAVAAMTPVLGFTGARTWAGRERAPADPRQGEAVFERAGATGTARVWRIAPPATATPARPTP